ncbi:MAG: dTDP-4-dehydrorhamnose 3,5-epimerase family protein [Candidatus Helarchaeota archaeon]
MIDGVERIPLKKINDERGFFLELIRSDSKYIREEILQMNMSQSYPNVIRAWHRHLRGQVDYFICISGSMKICVYDDCEGSETFGELDEMVVRGDTLEIIRVPGIFWHGFKVIGNESARLIYGVNRLYDYTNPDEERRSWNDPLLIPVSINGNMNDQRVGEAWDWNYPPHR